MRRLLFCFIVGIVPAVVVAQSINGRLTTSVYSWQRKDSAETSYAHLRGFQGAQFDFRYSDFSLHTYMQASTDLSNKLTEDPLVRFYNLYLRWRNIGGIGEFQLGRLPVFAGVGNGVIDGALAKAALFDGKMAVTAYYGGILPLNQKLKLTDDISHNRMMGGQIIVNPMPAFHVGVSYMNRQIKPDIYTTSRITLDSTIPFTVDLAADAEEFISGDISYRFESLFSIYARYDYDLNLDRNGRIEFAGRLHVTESLWATANFIHRVPHISANSIFSVFNYTNSDEIEGGLVYNFAPTAQVYARFGHVAFKDAKTQRISLGGRWWYFEGGYSKNLGYAGALDGIHVNAVIPLMESKITGSCGVEYASYKLSDESETDKSISGVLGISYRPFTSISLDLQGQYCNNKIYKSDGRIFFRLNYWFFNQL
jgi:hypothetical protein